MKQSQSRSAPAESAQWAIAQLEQALTLQRQGQLAQAQAICQELLALRPGLFDALHLLGVIALDDGNPARAVDFLDQAIAVSPQHAACHFNRGKALKQLGRAEEAVASYDKGIAVDPGNAVAWSNRGNALQELKLLDAALASYDKALGLEPGYAPAWYNRASVLMALGLPEAALASHDKALSLKPDHAPGHCNRGNVLRELGDLDGAIASYDRSIAIRPDHAEAHVNKAIVLLMRGDLEQGFAEYEWRWKRKDLVTLQREVPAPLWLGDAPLKDKTLLLHSEQGLGDTLQFCRYARLAAAQGAKVLLHVQPPLEGLLAGLEGVSELIGQGGTATGFHYHCPLHSLPFAFRTTLATIPDSEGYLRSDASKVSMWAERLGPRTAPRVGLVWSGNPDHANDRNRSIPLALLCEYLPKGLDYVSLQPDVRDSDQVALRSHRRIRHFKSELRDFSDTAALCDLMDVVISVDTSVVHLAGALGVKTWLLLSHITDWRWLIDSDDSPWYASLKLYRQGRDREWGPVLARVKDDLARISKTR